MIIKCKECGEELDTTAKVCSKCGCPIGKKKISVPKVILGLFLIIIGISLLSQDTDNTSNNETSKSSTTGVAITSDGLKVTHDDDFEIIREETSGKRNEDGTYTITGKLKQNIEGSYTGIMPTFNLLDVNGKKVRTTSGLMITNYEGDNVWTFTVNGNDADGVVADYELLSCYGY